MSESTKTLNEIICTMIDDQARMPDTIVATIGSILQDAGFLELDRDGNWRRPPDSDPEEEPAP